jgi:hypothetical protein
MITLSSNSGLNHEPAPISWFGIFIFIQFESKLSLVQIKTPSVAEGSCAQDWIRTSTPFRAPPPQSGLSTNFNTWANENVVRTTLLNFCSLGAANVSIFSKQF